MAFEESEFDLRTFFKSVGSVVGGPLSDSSARLMCEEEIEVLDSGSFKIDCEPVLVAGGVDGIQSQMVVCFREHRPVILSYSAAGCLSAVGLPLSVREKLQVICSEIDKEWVSGVCGNIPVELVGVGTAPEIERECVGLLSAIRDNLEQVVLRDLFDQVGNPLPASVPRTPGFEVVSEVNASGGAFIVDGALGSRPEDLRLIGIVKSVGKRYLKDESDVFALKSGYRSARFFIKAGVAGRVGRYSCYLRLHPASGLGWSHGLIRVEAFNPELLDAACAFALRNRQFSAAVDARWDRHLQIIRGVEDFLRARRPVVFSLR